MERPITTLFLLQSVDGKITTGDTDALDIEKDFIRIAGVKEGLQQYYDLEQKTDLVSFNTGKVLAKAGANEREWTEAPDDVSFVMVDNHPHLKEKACIYFAKRSPNFYVVTTNENHPAFFLKQKYANIQLLFYKRKIDFVNVFQRLKEQYGIERMTIQSGGMLNAELLRLGLIDRVSLVVAPCLIGGKDTQSLIGGASLHTQEELKHIKALKLIKCDVLENSYLQLQYEVIKETVIEG
jgi:2,5-diamino-6-(ribosylamino)-4(3H)-pyrimidinone 5'-phosphate reductase